jgi:hypothetical protein
MAIRQRYKHTYLPDRLTSSVYIIFQRSPSNSRLETAGPVSTGPYRFNIILKNHNIFQEQDIGLRAPPSV